MSGWGASPFDCFVRTSGNIATLLPRISTELEAAHLNSREPGLGLYTLASSLQSVFEAVPKCRSCCRIRENRTVNKLYIAVWSFNADPSANSHETPTLNPKPLNPKPLNSSTLNPQTLKLKKSQRRTLELATPSFSRWRPGRLPQGLYRCVCVCVYMYTYMYV